jgi:hypothetical protein
MKYSRFSGKPYSNYVPRNSVLKSSNYNYRSNRQNDDDLGTGDWDDDLDPEDRARLMGRDFMGPRWK